MGKKVKVFQMGFDIAEGEGIPFQQRGSLFCAIQNLIDNFYDENGKRVDFESLGIYNEADMTNQYEYFLKNQQE